MEGVLCISISVRGRKKAIGKEREKERVGGSDGRVVSMAISGHCEIVLTVYVVDVGAGAMIRNDENPST